MSVMFGKKTPKPDAALLARVSDTSDVDLGTYPEDALAVTGAYPARAALDPRPDGPSAFRQLDTQSRQVAMQAALDRLIADGTLNVPHGTSLKDVVADGLDGKLAVTGPMADLYRLACWFHRRGFQSGMAMFMETTEGLKDAVMPPGVPAPGAETCLAVQPPDGGDVSVLLVERNNTEAGTRSYTLRTVRRQFTRMGAFLFADVIAPGEALRVRADQQYRFGQKSLKIENEFVRHEGEDTAIGRVIMHATKPKNREPRYIKITQSELIDLMTSRFVTSAGRTQ
ncbi:MAG TPA: hypothetical protein VMC83_41590 [Streptosporangiaceae bacterium]|nr:hypothetical protein [Streptosporangiaceae bacterium]